MPHTAATRATALEKIRRLRREWIAANGPCKQCGSAERLHAHHEDPTQKISHNVWSWRPERRIAELAKCIALCQRCHIEHHAAQWRKPHGLKTYRRGCRCEICRAARLHQSQSYRTRNRDKIAASRAAWQAANSYRDRYEIIEGS
jgi:hypothetical protein